MSEANSEFYKLIQDFLKLELPFEFSFKKEENLLMADLKDFSILIHFDIEKNNAFVKVESIHVLAKIDELRNHLQQNNLNYALINNRELEGNIPIFYSDIDKNKTAILDILKKEIDKLYSIILFFRLYSYKNYKISKIELKKFNQFENLQLDLTYPKGHEKQGKPLQKVCFIGQNGTGKTSILKIIKAFIDQNKDNSFIQGDKNEINTTFSIDNLWKLYLNYSKKIFSYLDSESIFKIFNKSQTIFTLEKKYIHFPADIINKPQNTQMPFHQNGIFDFDIHSAMRTWDFVKKGIVEYNTNELAERKKIVDAGYTATAEELKKLSEAFEKWKIENPSPINLLADKCLDSFLKKFNLRVKTKLNFAAETDINNIKIENLQGEELGNLENTLSTGTKQILYTAMPLYTLKPESTIVLFDEPERSLYPDIQKEIVEFYTRLSPESQFFFATHSPIIVSSFEPWEIIELEYDSSGKVQQKLWYKGDRHVENYQTDARYLSWDDIFMKLFGLKQDGSDLRLEKLMETISLRKNLEKQKFAEQEKEIKLKEYKHLAQLVNYNFGK